MENKLYVGNLAFSLSQDEISDLFSQSGEVLSINLITDRDTGRPRGFGFVEMSTDEEAQRAIEDLNGKEVGGRALNVNIARARQPSRDRY